MTRKRHRLRRFAKWAGVAVCMTAFVLIPVSGYHSLAYTLDYSIYYVSEGCVGVRDRFEFAGWRYTESNWVYGQNPDGTQTWLPYWHHWYPLGKRFGVSVSDRGLPLWCVAIIAAIPTYILFRRDRRHPPGHCQSCGYNLTGNESGRCPECGVEVEA